MNKLTALALGICAVTAALAVPQLLSSSVPVAQTTSATAATTLADADYQTELPLQTVCGPLRVRGRADGYDPRRRCLEEVKTIRGHPDDIPEKKKNIRAAKRMGKYYGG